MIKTLIVLGILCIHLLWINFPPSYTTPDLIFPVWILSQAKDFVSEEYFNHPPLLPNILAFLSQYLDVKTSFLILQIFTVLILDLLLFFLVTLSLNSTFGILALLFYVPWQVFFQGETIYFDFYITPFTIVATIMFMKFVKTKSSKDFLLTSTILSLGYLFKQTVLLFIAAFFVIGAFILYRQSSSYLSTLKNLSIFLIPPAVIITFNSLYLSTFAPASFTLQWSFLIPIFAYARTADYPRFITTSYVPVIGLLLAIFLFSVALIERGKSKKNDLISGSGKYILYLATALSFLNIFPRWSPFHLQPFLFFLSILFLHAIYRLNSQDSRYFKISLSVLAIFLAASIAIMVNRVVTEVKISNTAQKDIFLEYAPESLNSLIWEKSVFVYDSPLYRGYPQTREKANFFSDVLLMLFKPDLYYRTTSPQVSLEYVSQRKPDYVIIPAIIKYNLDKNNLTVPFEQYISQNYEEKLQINVNYWIYERENSSVNN